MKRSANITSRLALIMLLFTAGRSTLHAQETDYKAYTLFIYNFMKYVEWPENSNKGEFVISVMGDSPINKELQDLAATKKLKGRTIVFKKCTTAEEALNAHLVFFPSQKSALLKTFKEQTKGRPVLLVCEREGLASRGAGISFVTMDDDELKFDINKKDIEQRHLKIANSLVSLGMVIN